jgi:hypothetical protein
VRKSLVVEFMLEELVEEWTKEEVCARKEGKVAQQREKEVAHWEIRKTNVESK